MTMHEWLNSQWPEPMLWSRRKRATERKYRLFACACCHRIRHLMTDARCRSAIEVAERFADGGANSCELQVAEKAAAAAVLDAALLHDHTCIAQSALAVVQRSCTRKEALQVAQDAAHYAMCTVWWEKLGTKEGEAFAQVELVREIFCDRYRPVFVPDWRTDTTVSLARQMYESREFGAMPILADALQDAGCDNDDILTHCRGRGPHVRGCWVVDLILGKE